MGLECETLLETCPLNKSSEQKNVILIDGINENREFEMEISEDEDPTPNPPVTHATIILDSEDKCPESFDECKKESIPIELRRNTIHSYFSPIKNASITTEAETHIIKLDLYQDKSTEPAGVITKIRTITIPKSTAFSNIPIELKSTTKKNESLLAPASAPETFTRKQLMNKTLPELSNIIKQYTVDPPLSDITRAKMKNRILAIQTEANKHRNNTSSKRKREIKKKVSIPVQGQAPTNSLDPPVDHINPINDSPNFKKRKLRSNTSTEDLEPKANNI